MRNLFDRLPPRVIRAIYATVAVAAVVLGGANIHQVMMVRATGNDQCRWVVVEKGASRLMITDIVSGGVVDRAGIRDGDLLLRINGETFSSDFEAQLKINRLIGSMARYTVERDGRTFETDVLILKAINMSFLAMVLQGGSLLIIGVIVVMARPQGRIQRMFARYGILSFLFFSHAQGNYDQTLDPMWRVALFGGTFVFAGLVGPPAFVQFFLNFPVRMRLADSKPLKVVLYVLAAIFTAVIAFGPRVGIPQGLAGAAYFTRFTFILFGFSFFVYAYFRLVRPERRRALRPILVGVGLGMVAFVYMLAVAAIDQFAAFLNPIILLPALLLPLAAILFGYAIIRYRLMDMDLIVKRSLIYGLVTATVAAIYVGTVYVAGSLAADLLGEEPDRLATFLALVVVAFAFDPLKRNAQEWIDRVFYQERYNYQRALLEFAQELPRRIDLREILESMVHRIATTMHIEKVAVILCDPEGSCESAEQNVPRACCRFGDTEGGLIRLLRSTQAAQSFALLAEEPESVKLSSADKRTLLDGGIVLAVPMFLTDRLIGIINVGPKHSGKLYTRDDIELLTAVGAQAAVAIENARLHAMEFERQKIREELSLALKIQQGLLPKGAPSMPGLDISGYSRPALQVGGDYYDFIEIGRNKLLVVVADVAGKGMSAALYMSKVQGMVQLAAHMYRSPREMLSHINRRIFDGIERRSFITMILALFDLEKRQVRICRAGHNRALIGANGSMEFVESPGIGLGLERGPIFDRELREVVRPLRPDSVYLFYTDGVTEAMNEEGKEFGEEPVKRLLAAKRHLSAGEIQHHVLSAVEEFQGSAEPHDDVTMVVVRSGKAVRRKGR
ncbi:MAG: SpoIIE family protein phosphatase [Bacteroidetes bacterium]|jgi:sigma-B regulation protein RsbU (phosphoserine phosphatase)|nr:SpoIIE family protein phosphatase [Bacteroidota bacterium]